MQDVVAWNERQLAQHIACSDEKHTVLPDRTLERNFCDARTNKFRRTLAGTPLRCLIVPGGACSAANRFWARAPGCLC